MSRQIESVAVIGCGTMGSGIAAASAAAGCRVLMLDVSSDAVERGRAAVADEDRHLVETGTFDPTFETLGDLDRIADFDWICEAVIEDLDTKRRLFETLEPLRADGSVISSNTSGIPLRDISADLPERFRSDVAITHFFNPVKVMKLFELVPGEDTSNEVVDAFARFGAERLGKGVVNAKDTVNFIGNRIGCYFMLSGLHLAKPFLADGMTQETIDAVLGRPVGLPPTGLYGLIDLIGLDVMDLVGKNLAANLLEGDAGLAFTALPPAERRMLERGQLGRKTGGGFARLLKLKDDSRKKETFDLIDEAWRDAVEPDLDAVPGDLGEVMFTETPQGELAWQIFGGTLRYAAGLVPEIADDIVNIDRAIRWGFNWVHGPFEMIDAIGADRISAKIEDDGSPLPAMLRVLRQAGADSFYGDDGGRYLGLDGDWHDVPAE